MCEVLLGSLVLALKWKGFQGKSDDPPACFNSKESFESSTGKCWALVCVRTSPGAACCIWSTCSFTRFWSCFEVYTRLVHTITSFCHCIHNLGIRLAGLPGKENKSDLWNSNRTNTPRQGQTQTFPSHGTQSTAAQERLHVGVPPVLRMQFQVRARAVQVATPTSFLDDSQSKYMYIIHIYDFIHIFTYIVHVDLIYIVHHSVCEFPEPASVSAPPKAWIASATLHPAHRLGDVQIHILRIHRSFLNMIGLFRLFTSHQFTSIHNMFAAQVYVWFWCALFFPFSCLCAYCDGSDNTVRFDSVLSCRPMGSFKLTSGQGKNLNWRRKTYLSTYPKVPVHETSREWGCGEEKGTTIASERITGMHPAGNIAAAVL